MDNQLLKYGAKDYFFRATLCRMCQEVEDATTTIGKYEEMFPAFSDSRECKLVKVKLLANVLSSSKIYLYRPHPKDGEGTVFTGVCLPSPVTGPVQSPARRGGGVHSLGQG